MLISSFCQHTPTGGQGLGQRQFGLTFRQLVKVPKAGHYVWTFLLVNKRQAKVKADPTWSLPRTNACGMTCREADSGQILKTECWPPYFCSSSRTPKLSSMILNFLGTIFSNSNGFGSHFGGGALFKTTAVFAENVLSHCPFTLHFPFTQQSALFFSAAVNRSQHTLKLVVFHLLV